MSRKLFVGDRSRSTVCEHIDCILDDRSWPFLTTIHMAQRSAMLWCVLWLFLSNTVLAVLEPMCNTEMFGAPELVDCTLPLR